MIELIVTLVVAAIPLLAMGTLLVGAQESWRRTYDSVHKPIREHAAVLSTAFTTVGRKSNRSNYKIYQVKNGTFTEAAPEVGKTLATGQAVEFRYWEDGFDPGGATMKTLETTNMGTQYALFYLDGTELKVDYGDVIGDIGGVRDGRRYDGNLNSTVVLAGDVDVAAHDEIFGHTVIGGAGQGCVRLNVRLKDKDGVELEIKTAALCRVVWPR